MCPAAGAAPAASADPPRKEGGGMDVGPGQTGTDHGDRQQATRWTARVGIDDVVAALGRPGRGDGAVTAGNDAEQRPGPQGIRYPDPPRHARGRLAPQLHVAPRR
ncbi:hypothetical protein GCM10020000_02280 [Streptomyces olivoverticillatus]